MRTWTLTVTALSCVASVLACGARGAEVATVAAISPQQFKAETGKAHPLDLKSVVIAPTDQGRTLDVGYNISLGGLTLMSIDVKAVVEGGHYVITSFVATKGLADLFVSANVQALSTGDVIGKTVVPHTYNSDIQDPKKRQLVGLLFGDKGPLSVDASPAYDSRFPVSDELKASTVDPISGLLFIALGSSAKPDAPCGVNVPVFDGRRRYDLKLDFKANDKVSARGAYEGPALHCIARYQRVAGFKPPKHGKKASEVPPIDVWLAPLEGGEMLVPVRLQLDSDFGGIVAKATRLTVGGKAHQG